MDLSFRFDFWFQGLRASPTDDGEISGIVIRPPELGHGGRKILERVQLDPEVGLVGDRWPVCENKTGDDQVSLVNVHVLRSLAGDDPEQMARSGDNLHVDLDLTEANLPVGSLLELGEAQLEVSPQPHVPCEFFYERYGVSAVKKVLRANKRGRRGRGVLCMVVKPGEISVGGRIRILRRGPAAE